MRHSASVFLVVQDFLKLGIGRKFTIRVPCLAILLIQSTAIAEVPGGSNYAWYNIDGCTRDPYSVLTNFDKDAVKIVNQLKLMYKNGQRRLRIPVFFSQSSISGYLIVDKKGLSITDQKKILNFLRSLKAVGFKQVILSLFPQGKNLPLSSNYDPKTFDANLAIASQLRRSALQANIDYLIDLQNEGVPAANQEELLTYARRLWSAYKEKYGSGDTLGFSVIPEESRIKNLRAIYGSHLPRAMDLHVYGQPFATLIQTLAQLKKLGASPQSLIIGETYYDNEYELAQLRSAARVSGIPISFILQWPEPQNAACSNVSVVPLHAPESLISPPTD